MTVYVTDQVFVHDLYGEQSIQRRSTFHQQQVSEGENVWIKGSFKLNILEDESSLVQIGQRQERVFHSFQLDAPQPTSWVSFPTPEKPLEKFKFASFDIYFSQDIQLWTRQTYSFLDFLGDLGGLYDALIGLVHISIAPIGGFAVKIALLTTFEKSQPITKSNDSDKLLARSKQLTKQ